MCDHENREAAMVVIEDGVWCDPCLVPLVKALNNGGIRTVASCCGHGKVAGSIILADNTWLHIQKGEVVDGDWVLTPALAAAAPSTPAPTEEIEPATCPKCGKDHRHWDDPKPLYEKGYLIGGCETCCGGPWHVAPETDR